MKVYVEVPPGLSKAMERVVAALKNYAPRSIKFVKEKEDAELVLLHVIGYPETIAAVEECQERKQKFGIIQYCLRSTQKPDTRDWASIWQAATIVWSYYDLPKLCVEDGWAKGSFPFYHSPLGADPIFSEPRPTMHVKMYTMLTTGYVAESEGVLEVAEAVRRIGGRHFHLGPRDVAPNADMIGFGLSDHLLVDVYSRCCWVAGLRRCEGFEMPAAEGLVSGARPIMFDAPHYRKWFEPWAEFIPEGTFDETVDALVAVFDKGYRAVTEKERGEASRRFNWNAIVVPFWMQVLQ
jgi:hypothetical protein